MAWSRPRPVVFSLALILIAAGAPATALAVDFTAPTNIVVGDGPSDVAAGDFNGDLDPDLAIVNTFSYDVSVLLGGAGASFSGPTDFAAGGTHPRAVAIGDFDADTDPDLALAGGDFSVGSGHVSVLLGSTGGAFGAPTSYSNNQDPHDVAIGDFNGDTDPDLAVVNVGGVAVLLGGMGGTFGTWSGFNQGGQPRSVAVADFNRETDSDPDLAVLNISSNHVSVLLGEAGGSFGTATNYSLPADFGPSGETLGLAIGDFNGDGDPDVAVGGSGKVAVLLGEAAGSFGAPTTLEVGGGPLSVAIGHFNADSDPDLVVIDSDFPRGHVSVLLGGVGATFGAPTRFRVGGSPGSVAIGDFNADSDPDLAVANGLSDNISVLLNREHAPAPPTLTATDPASPSNDNSPKVTGTAAAGSTVRLYSSADCTGAPAATGSAAEFASSGLQVSVPDDSTTSFKATATNPADVPSGCSSSSLSYIEHSSPPNAALSVSPNPVLTGATVSFDASSTTGFGITKYEWDLDGDGTFEPEAGGAPTAARTFAAAGELNPGVRVTNDLGSSVARVPLSIRLAPPPGPVGVSVVALDGNRQYTRQPQVTIAAVWPELTRTLTISNDGGFTSPGVFPVAPQTSWMLESSGIERLPKTVYVRFDGSSQTFTDDIILDETDPTISSARFAGSGSTVSAAAARRYRLRLRARDNVSGVARFQLGGKRRQRSRAKRLGGTRRTIARTLSVRSSFKPRRVRVQDAAGNWSRWKRIKRAS